MLLNNTLCCNSYLFKYNYRSSVSCNMCCLSNIEYVYFFIVNMIKLYEAFELSVWCSIKTFYHRYFFLERNVKKQFLNTILYFVAYKIMLPTLKIVNKTILIESKNKQIHLCLKVKYAICWNSLFILNWFIFVL